MPYIVKPAVQGDGLAGYKPSSYAPVSEEFYAAMKKEEAEKERAQARIELSLSLQGWISAVIPDRNAKSTGENPRISGSVLWVISQQEEAGKLPPGTTDALLERIKKADAINKPAKFVPSPFL